VADEPSRAGRLRELAMLFLRLGTTAFGGPAAHIAMMEDEVVRRRGWLTREKFLDLLGATNLIPGPNSTEMAIHIGHQRAGLAGLIVSGSCFIFPAVFIVLGLAWVYVRFGSLPEAGGFLYGVKAVILAVIVHALWRLGRAAVKKWDLGVVCALSVGAVVAGVHELLILLGAGVVFAAWRGIVGSMKDEGGTRRDETGKPGREASKGKAGERKAEASRARIAFPLLPFRGKWLVPAAAAGTGAGAATAAGAAAFSLSQLFLFFLRTGAVLFGSGYVLLAFIRADLVERWHWLTEQQLLDAIAVGQFTPGPVFTTATFIGYVLGGVPGAVAATVGIVLPAFFFVAVSGPLIPRLRRSKTAGAFLDGVVVASLALMAVVTFQLGRAAIIDVPSAALAVVGAVLHIRFKVNWAWLVLAGGALGLLIAWLR
jgi:chromate transporter